MQRFAANVVYYTLSGSTFNPAKPFSASIKVWKFTGRIYDEIEGIQQEIGDLRRHDITLECEEPNWQRNKLAFRMEPAYKEAPSGYLKELLSTPGNRATDAQLKDACGSAVPRERMQEDCEFAMRQWRKLRNEGEVPAAFKSTAADLAGGIDDLLGEETKDAGTVLTQDRAVPGGVAVADDPFAEFMPDAAPASPPAAPEKAAASTKKPAISPTAPPSEVADPFAGALEETASAQPETATTESAAATASPSSGDFDFDNLLDGI